MWEEILCENINDLSKNFYMAVVASRTAVYIACIDHGFNF